MNIVPVILAALMALGASLNAGSHPPVVTAVRSAVATPTPTPTPAPARYDVISGGGPT